MGDFSVTRQSKRRRVSGEPTVVDDGNINAADDSMDTPPSIRRSSRRNATESAKQRQQTSDGHSEDPLQDNAGASESTQLKNEIPNYEASRANEQNDVSSKPQLRSSGRTRKTPKWLAHDAEQTMPTTTRNTRSRASTSTNTDAGKGTTRTRAANTPQKTAPSRRRPRQQTKNDAEQNENQNGRQSPILDNKEELQNVPENYLEPESNSVEDMETLAAAQLQTQLANTDEPTPDAEELPSYARDFGTLCENEGLEKHLDTLSNFVLGKLTGKHLVPLKGLDSEYRTVHQLLEQTVLAGEGNSLLLLGSRGSGKTAAVETAISSLARDQGDNFHVVRLSGFLHTDDRIALKEIWRQLGRETSMESEMDKISSYADTMASLLALLSHPEELNGAPEDSNMVTTTKSVIILLDEFDLFTYHSRQTLLYNLFDIAQAKKAPLAVLGLTTKVDVTENLEKRVKSRFSHRYVFMPRPRSFTDFSNICMAALKVEEEEIANLINAKGEDGVLSLLEADKGKTLLEGWRIYVEVRPYKDFILYTYFTSFQYTVLLTPSFLYI